MLAAELESLAHAPLDDAGAVSVLRWHALSGYSLELTQFTGGRVTIVGGTGALLDAIASGGAVRAPAGDAGGRGRGSGRRGSRSRPATARGSRRARSSSPCRSTRWARSSSRPALPEDKQRAIALGQASRGIKIFIRARGEAVLQNAIRPGHPFGYLGTEERSTATARS